MFCCCWSCSCCCALSLHGTFLWPFQGVKVCSLPSLLFIHLPFAFFFFITIFFLYLSRSNNWIPCHIKYMFFHLLPLHSPWFFQSIHLFNIILNPHFYYPFIFSYIFSHSGILVQCNTHNTSAAAATSQQTHTQKNQRFVFVARIKNNVKCFNSSLGQRNCRFPEYRFVKAHKCNKQ